MPTPTDGLADAAAVKAQLRTEMRALRRAVDRPEQRSAVICEHLAGLAALADAHAVMVFTPVPGEPDVRAFAARCHDEGRTVVVPEDEPEPAAIDLVLVPGVAFTADGWRLGQGGGWYDRFLPMLRPEAVTVGVAFAAQVVDALPVEPHDVPVDHLVTDASEADGAARSDD